MICSVDRRHHCVRILTGLVCMLAASLGLAAGGSSPAPQTAQPAAQKMTWIEVTPPQGLAMGSSQSTFAVVTRKAGLASALAHHHFIYAKGYSIKVESGESTRAPVSARVVFDAEALMVDDPAAIDPASSRLMEWGVDHAKFSELSDSDRKTIREGMLAEGQLWAQKFPRIEAVASDFKQRAGKVGSIETTHEAQFVFTIRGRSVTKTVPLRIVPMPGAGVPAGAAVEASERGPFLIEGLTTARFTEFGFEPYSGFLGAVRNDDTFHFYLRTQGLWTP